jgi:hypothetical protein
MPGSRAHAILVVVATALATVTAHAEPVPRKDPAAVLGYRVPAEVVALLRETREAFGADAAALQVQLLHRVVQAGSILPAGVRVRGVEPHGAHRYLVFFVETGIVFNSNQTDGAQRLDQLWSSIVLPLLRQVSEYAVPGDGIALELAYGHRPYASVAELTETVSENPGRPESAALYLLHRDIVAFRREEIGARELRLRSETLLADPSTASSPPPGPSPAPR